MYSFQLAMKAKMVTVARTGLARGMMMPVKVRRRLEPSMNAASSSSRGMVRKNWRRRKT